MTPAAPGYRESLYADYVSGHNRTTEAGSGRPELETDILPLLPRDRSSVILDIGCGPGELVALLLDRGYLGVKGVDISAEQVAAAHRLGRENVHLGDLFEIADAERARYDAVAAIDVIEHFDRDEAQRVFQAFADLLKPGGRFVFRSPNGGSPFLGRYLYGDLTHGIVYTQRSLEQVCNLTGLDRLQIFPSRPAGRTFRRRARRVAWYVMEALIKTPLIIESGIPRGHIVTQNLVGVAYKAGD